MSICSLFLLLAAAIYAIGATLARHWPDYREEQQPPANHTAPDVDEGPSPAESAHLPLLTDSSNSERTRLHSDDV